MRRLSSLRIESDTVRRCWEVKPPRYFFPRSHRPPGFGSSPRRLRISSMLVMALSSGVFACSSQIELRISSVSQSISLSFAFCCQTWSIRPAGGSCCGQLSTSTGTSCARPSALPASCSSRQDCLTAQSPVGAQLHSEHWTVAALRHATATTCAARRPSIKGYSPSQYSEARRPCQHYVSRKLKCYR